ncbi:hypothetical protein [Vibrio harveyi]|uniref:hypothetical protein n=1 Tax=Vibrio harveyi TaxID=669 RepID=UPI0013040064|nr:hypothetical protein [Vibrio harveyi]EKO3844860.1 hypothetical protein [Vibrio harveyi]
MPIKGNLFRPPLITSQVIALYHRDVVLNHWVSELFRFVHHPALGYGELSKRTILKITAPTDIKLSGIFTFA